MRFVVFLLGVLSSFLAGVFGWLWLDYGSSRKIEELLRDYVNVGFMMPDYAGTFDDVTRAAIFLVIGALLGLLGSVFTLMRRGRQGAVLMILAAIGPAIINFLTLLFTGPLALVGLLSLFVRPLPAAAPAEID